MAGLSANNSRQLIMSRPTKTLVHDGEEWLAMLTGGMPPARSTRIGVLFFAKATDEGDGRTPARHPPQVRSCYGGSKATSGFGLCAVRRRGLTKRFSPL